MSRELCQFGEGRFRVIATRDLVWIEKRGTGKAYAEVLPREVPDLVRALCRARVFCVGKAEAKKLVEDIAKNLST